MAYYARTHSNRRRKGLDFAGASKLKGYSKPRQRRSLVPWVVCIGLLVVVAVDSGLV